LRENGYLQGSSSKFEKRMKKSTSLEIFTKDFLTRWHDIGV
jgi:hypothetical protein